MGQVTLGDQAVEQFLDSLAARQSTPGGGATAALSVAQAAALVAMVARYSDGPKYEADRQQIGDAVTAADRLRQHSLGLAVADEEAFGAVSVAYGLPHGSEQEKSDRQAAIADALAGAAEPPIEVVTAAGRVVALAASLVPVGNRTLIADLAAAAEAARAGAGIGLVNIQVNLVGIRDETMRTRCLAAIEEVARVRAAAEVVATEVLAEVSGAGG